ncbi:MAG: DNA repair protein RecO, partial [bacterium]|nr:DNA repair protein RecO [bacterium]
MTFTATAIILRRRDIGEWDRLYTMYTREHGKLVVIGKGTRRAKAKLAAHLEPFTEADLVIARGRTIDRITFARTIRAHATALRTYDDVQVASFLVECVEQLTEPQHRDAALFELLQTAVALVAQHAHAEIITPFLLRCLSILGYAPHLDRCAECRANL